MALTKPHDWNKHLLLVLSCTDLLRRNWRFTLSFKITSRDLRFDRSYRKLSRSDNASCWMKVNEFLSERQCKLPLKTIFNRIYIFHFLFMIKERCCSSCATLMPRYYRNWHAEWCSKWKDILSCVRYSVSCLVWSSCCTVKQCTSMV